MIGFSEFRPDWRKESSTYIKANLDRRVRELEGARLVLGVVQQTVLDIETDIACMTDALVQKATLEAMTGKDAE